jgi:hypothetical protein
MISVVVCSIDPETCERMMESVDRTIGVEHEFVVHDNRETNWGICKAYNRCAGKAKFPFLAFAHEDLVMDSPGWGKMMIDFCERRSDVGVIGVAGSMLVPKNFVSWGDDPRFDRYNFWQTAGAPDEWSYFGSNPQNEDFSEVVTLDGVFLFTRKKVWQEYPFDEGTFRRYHLYDADFSVSVSRGYRNFVNQRMFVKHLSRQSGVEIKEYFEELRLFHRKWFKLLPLSASSLGLDLESEILKIERRNLAFLFRKFTGKLGAVRAIAHFLRIEPIPFVSMAAGKMLRKIARTFA